SEEKFQAWAETVESCFGNPLYHWTHLELQYYFGIEDNLDTTNWRDIMSACNRLLSQDDFKPRALITRSNVDVICTTDSPLDSLEYHRLLRDDADFTTQVLPTFRPDDIFEENPQQFGLFIEKLSALTGVKIVRFADLSQAMEQRIEYFHASGCRISDHGPVAIHYQPATAQEIENVFAKKCAGETLTPTEHTALISAIFVMLAGHYKKRQWSMQIHFGAIRSNNSLMKEKIGINTGFDSIADQCHLAQGLNGLLDAMARNNALPKTILYNLNPIYNDIVATTIANFQSA
ncbi:MAG TPA: glucuronate isomerase, partial [Atlantibacter hermannii]|nr:glucuronate isomerase [Atlantibacter hermannii]